jgi:hypothetical protein
VSSINAPGGSGSAGTSHSLVARENSAQGVCAGYRQVFGLTGSGKTHLLVAASQLIREISQCVMETFVPAYRCGAALDFHQVPFQLLWKTDGKINIRQAGNSCQRRRVV